MLLEVSGLYKAFKGTSVLQDINFSVKKGEIVSLLGQSGAGKTTIIRCITGLEKPDKGSIAVNGRFMCEEKDGKMVYAAKQDLYDIRKQMGMVFQSYHLFPHMTVLKNVMLALTNVHKLSSSDAEKRAMDMLQSLGTCR